jgi:hypothetical protein
MPWKERKRDIMAHDPSKYNCCDCKKRKIIEQDGIEVASYCNLDRKRIEFWGLDKCPLLNNSSNKEV